MVSVASRLGLLMVCGAAAGCGMKGPPLTPLQRVPAAAGSVAVERFDQDVFVRFVVPSTDIEGIGIATIDRIEVYGITLEAVPGQPELQTETMRKAATLISQQHVRLPLPPPDPEQPAIPAFPQEPGLDQGAPGVARETLTAEAQQPVRVAGIATPLPPVDTAMDEPTMAPAPTFVSDDLLAPRRYYFVVGVTRTGRYGQTSAPIAVPLAGASSAPSAPRISYDERAVKLEWAPAADARIAAGAVADVLPSRSLSPVPPETRYDVYAIAKAAPAGASVDAAPRPLNDAPLSALELVVPGVRFGAEQCFAVRPVDTVAGVVVHGPASALACDTPRDTFPPEAPKAPAAVAGAGSIALIWEPNAEPDLAGYVVLRGEAGTDRLMPLTPSPVRETTFRDTNVRPGVRYVYAIVAVDTASPQNVSGQSVRVEETARQ